MDFIFHISLTHGVTGWLQFAKAFWVLLESCSFAERQGVTKVKMSSWHTLLIHLGTGFRVEIYFVVEIIPKYNQVLPQKLQ